MAAPTDPTLPAGACDSHLHVYDPRFAYVAGASLTPAPARIDDYRAVQRRLGLQRAVVVQPSSYGVDNRCTLDAVAGLGIGTTRAVVVIEPGLDASALAAMHAAGARGVRLNLLRGASIDRPAWTKTLALVAEAGWHLQLHCGPADMVALEGWLDTLPLDIVFDHLGRVPPHGADRDAGMRFLLRRIDRGTAWVKVSGWYLDSREGPPDYADIAPWAKTLIRHAPERTLWGSDWPHPGARSAGLPQVDDGLLLAAALDWCGSARSFERMLVENPEVLYGFGSST